MSILKVICLNDELCNTHKSSMVLLNTHWKNVSKYANKLRENNINIHKATIHKNNSILYINDNSYGYISYERKNMINDYLNSVNTDGITNSSFNIRLHPSTIIKVYNTPSRNTTTLEFSCNDRIGLLADLCEMLSYFPYDISTAYINTHGNKALNIIMLEKDSKSLNNNDIQYITNVFEYEIKKTKYLKDESY